MKQDRAKIDWRPFGWPLPRLLLVALVGLFCVVLLVVVSSSTAGFSSYNPDWDGTSDFRQLTADHSELTVATNVSQYETQEPATTVGFIFAPETAYSERDAAILQQFVSNGGILIVSDNYGSNGNALLNAVGANARFDGRVLQDDRNTFRSPTTPVVSDIGSHEYMPEVESLTLNYGTAITPNGATPIANSSEFSYLVENENATAETADELQRYPVVTVESIGDGQVVAIGDPSLFINTMLDESDNRAFATTLVSHRAHTLIDRSHSGAVPPLIQILLLIRSSPLVATGLLVTVLMMVSIGGRQDEGKKIGSISDHIQNNRLAARLGYSASVSEIESEIPEMNRDTLKTHIQRRHPEWDEDQIETVLEGILSDRDDISENE